MTVIRPVLLGVGLLAVLTGVIWIGQGTGYFPYPASSFMINQPPWIIWGAILAAAGGLSVWASRRI